MRGRERNGGRTDIGIGLSIRGDPTFTPAFLIRLFASQKSTFPSGEGIRNPEAIGSGVKNYLLRLLVRCSARMPEILLSDSDIKAFSFSSNR